MNLICYICVFFSKVAIIAGNFELAESIKNHKDADIGKLDIAPSLMFMKTMFMIFFMNTRIFYYLHTH